MVEPPGHAKPPASSPPACPGSLSRPLEWRDSLPGSPSPGLGLQPGTGSYIKRLLSKESSHLWATLAARSKTQDLKSGCWRRAWDGFVVFDPWGTAAVAES